MKTNNKKSNDLLKINFYYYLKIILKKSPYIVLVSILFTVFSVFLVQNLIVPKYKAVAKIIRYDKKISMPKDVPYKFQNFNYNTALQTVRTRKNLKEIIEKLQLDITVEQLYSQFEVKRGRNSDIIEIFYTNSDIDLAVKGANLLSTVFLKNFYEVQNAATKEIYNYYNLQHIEIKEVIEKLQIQKEIFNKRNNILSLKTQKDYKYEQLHELSLSLTGAKILLNEYLTKVDQIKTKLNLIPKEVQLNYSVRSADLKNIENKEKELTQLKQKYTTLNPKVIKLQSEISFMRKALTEIKNKKIIPDEITYGNNPLYTALKIELSQSNIGISTASNRIKEIKHQQEQLEKEIIKLNGLEKEFSLISNKLEQKQTLLNTIISRLNEVKIALDSSQEDFKFLEKATKPRYPESNYKKMIVVLFCFLGVLISISVIILKIFFDLRIKSIYDIEDRFNIKLLGKFSKTDDKEIQKRDNIDFVNSFLNETKDKKIILFSSDVEKTGKTVIIDKLTYHLSHHNKKVLYIQTVQKTTADTKNATIDYINSKSLIDSLSHTNKINENIDKLYILDDDSKEYLLTDEKIVKVLFEGLTQSKYDYVLFEIPSFQNNPYFFINMSIYSDLNCLVFRGNYSNRKIIIDLLIQKDKFNIKNIKGVINDLES